MDSYSISRLAHGIIDIASDEVARLFGSFVMIYRISDMNEAIECIHCLTAEEYMSHRIPNQELRELYTYLVIYRYLSKYGTEKQINNFIMYGDVEREGEDYGY